MFISPAEYEQKIRMNMSFQQAGSIASAFDAFKAYKQHKIEDTIKQLKPVVS